MKNNYSYVGVKSCGCVLAATKDDSERPQEVAKDVAEFIKDGLIIERHTHEWVRQHFGKCKMHQQVEKVEQLELI